MKLDAIWALIKPVIIIVLAAIGYFSAGDFFIRNLFLAIVVLSFLFRGGSIVAGFVAIYNTIFNKE